MVIACAKYRDAGAADTAEPTIVTAPLPPQILPRARARDTFAPDLTDLARSQVTELVPHELGAVFVISPVEEDHVRAALRWAFPTRS
ncbi:hypothetical protein WME97_04035 [Sorangium sp. So ce367]|uniref:hypothetical protein n=1 Tax=Sorangium sp. So ce367 TaxID=3133305 RepID=UPI003F63FCA7